MAATSLEDLGDLANTRVRLECMAFDLVVRQGDATWEAEVMATHHRLCCRPRKPDPLIAECWEALHRDFHLTLIGACGSPTLIGFCRNLHDLFDRYRRIAVQAAGTHPEMGQLAGNHFITLTGGLENLPALGESVLWEGAKLIRFELDDVT